MIIIKGQAKTVVNQKNIIETSEATRIEIKKKINIINVVSPQTKIEIATKGTQGVQGIQGEQGVQGIQGEKGEQGDPGLVDYSLVLKLDQTTPQYITNGAPVGLSEPSFTYTSGLLTRIDYPSGYYKEFSYNIDETLNIINYNGEYTKTMVWNIDGTLNEITVN